ncbi:MaoC family dehydratase [Streptomyces oceani]|uniref:MaoC-like domain-containing protein n=1 Tax=Streptomyces oceani TaxID=1075402 RepID=A0A1E7JWM4_9ACTN|nr:MaoC family dehydratase [Streptomyces oceani]OEU95999.1 hypothetical protein AN216_23035 [Streptomyces oceani]
MSLHTERFFEDYALGETGGGRSRTVDQSDVNTFAGLTMDFHPAHVDREFAQERFGGRLVHGVLTFGLVVGLTVEYNPRAVAYGYERVRFPGPVMAGDTITATSVVTELTEHRRPGIGLVTKRYTGVNQRAETVLSCLHILAVDRRD